MVTSGSISVGVKVLIYVLRGLVLDSHNFHYTGASLTFMSWKLKTKKKKKKNFMLTGFLYCRRNHCILVYALLHIQTFYCVCGGFTAW